MYSGQGSQYFQMGAELYQQNPRFRLWMDHCSEACYPLLDCELTDIIYGTNRMQDPFDRLFHNNPAIIAIQYSLTRVLMEQGINPAQTIGYSLGELASAIVSECIDIEAGLTLAIRFAELIETKTPKSGMLAVLSEQSIIRENPELFKNVTLTGENCNANFVVSGLEQHVIILHQALVERGVSCALLPVHYGFHTDIIDGVEQEFKSLANECIFQPANIPFLSLSKRQVMDSINADYLWDVFRHPVHFEPDIKELIKKGFNQFVDVSPSGSLSTFLKYIDKDDASSEIEIYPTISQFGSDLSALERLQAKLT